ncbi:tRNA glutamyl-Q(34) synthetase GluQRS [Williamsia sp. CHRR-6]|uniref:tRNA glutamyl-Q(34) synthetase GluQRS n=1 Tax=Williamsia sp. CHRR-6 TaxID=2835871 RepID=UPI001BDB0B9F|nr:tRNA glutamyl-Q(34) synthetase GluQRS [Williamsia sp. CHRR-6]MBT0567396.1 tRNA glutamyl-Q(34) synthetase GluQRS [Williamsia sp. CHRR-6]
MDSPGGGTSAGRYAPSPSGDLHIGNLRTALLAWMFARSTGRRFLLRIEDLDDRTSHEVAQRQLADLRDLGIDFDGEVMVQSRRTEVYDATIAELTAAGRTYECWCSRKEILAATRAPHAPPGAYPGTCRDLTASARAARRASGKPPAIRLRSQTSRFTIVDQLIGEFTGAVDDFVLRRGDGTAAYNLAVVVDDAASGVDQVVRGDDLLTSSPRQGYLATLIGADVPTYVHVPLVLNPAGVRLAKRDGAVTRADLALVGVDIDHIRGLIGRSLRLAGPDETPSAAQLLARFDPQRLPQGPWIVDPAEMW